MRLLLTILEMGVEEGTVLFRCCNNTPWTKATYRKSTFGLKIPEDQAWIMSGRHSSRQIWQLEQEAERSETHPKQIECSGGGREPSPSDLLPPARQTMLQTMPAAEYGPLNA